MNFEIKYKKMELNSQSVIVHNLSRLRCQMQPHMADEEGLRSVSSIDIGRIFLIFLIPWFQATSLCQLLLFYPLKSILRIRKKFECPPLILCSKLMEVTAIFLFLSNSVKEPLDWNHTKKKVDQFELNDSMNWVRRWRKNLLYNRKKKKKLYKS